VLEKLMHQPKPSADQSDALLPTAWIKLLQTAAGKTA
jgi:hypothetical protein